jgi:pimeloyl-ACP methyl ester carboxylesterase
VILIGQSFGCNIISHYSTRYPNKIEKIIFSSPGVLRPHRKINGNYVDIDSIYQLPDTLEFKDPYDFVKDVDNMALKPKAMVATVGDCYLTKN